MSTGDQDAAESRESELHSHGSLLSSSSHAYGLLLAAIVASLIFQLAAPDAGWARFVTVVAQGGTLLLALRVSGVGRRLTRIAVVVVVLAVLGAGVAVLGSGDLGRGAGRGIALALVALTPIAISFGVIAEIRAAKRVTIRVMFGALCIYLLLGMLFAFLYGFAGAVGDGSFFAQDDAETQSNYLYFSFTTQTTTGYGDLTAASRLGRSLAITEALVGQLYLVTVLALVVGNLGRSRTRS